MVHPNSPMVHLNNPNNHMVRLSNPSSPMAPLNNPNSPMERLNNPNSHMVRPSNPSSLMELLPRILTCLLNLGLPRATTMRTLMTVAKISNLLPTCLLSFKLLSFRLQTHSEL